MNRRQEQMTCIVDKMGGKNDPAWLEINNARLKVHTERIRKHEGISDDPIDIPYRQLLCMNLNGKEYKGIKAGTHHEIARNQSTNWTDRIWGRRRYLSHIRITRTTTGQSVFCEIVKISKRDDKYIVEVSDVLEG